MGFENLCATIIIFVICSSGAGINLLAMFTVLKNPKLRNPFGALCYSHSVANFGVLFIFLIWVAPTTYLQSEKTGGAIGKILGQINILFWNACCYSHLAVSLNRFLTILLPTKVSTIFSLQNTIILICIVWTLAIFHVIPYFWSDSCYVAYDPKSWTWIFGDTPCGYIITKYTDYYTSVFILISMSSLDFITFGLLMMYNKRTNGITSELMRKRRRIEIRFFIQSCIQGLIFFYEVFAFNFIVTLNSDKWFVFMNSTFAWEICHFLDGLVLVLFHFQRKMLSFSKITSTPAMSKSEVKSVIGTRVPVVISLL